MEKEKERVLATAAQEQVEHVRASSFLQMVVSHVSCGQQHAHTHPTKTTTGAVRWMHSACFYYKEPVNDVLEKSIVFSVSCIEPITSLLSYLCYVHYKYLVVSSSCSFNADVRFSPQSFGRSNRRVFGIL